MRVKHSNLKWNVLRYDFNSGKIVDYDVMGGVAEALQKQMRLGKVYDKATLKNFLKAEFMSHYWSRAEHEVLALSGIHNPEVIEKIDVWRQLEINLDQIVDYVIYKCNLKFMY